MARFVLSPRAQADIDEIWNYTTDRWGVEQAELYVRQLGSAVEAIAQDPRLGRPCDDIREGYRRYPSDGLQSAHLKARVNDRPR